MGEKPGVIIDTDILIKIYRGNLEHKRVLQEFSPGLIISCITGMELLIGCKNKKMQDEIEENLKLYKILTIDAKIISIVNEIIKKYSFSHKMSVADNFIAATALFILWKLILIIKSILLLLMDCLYFIPINDSKI